MTRARSVEDFKLRGSFEAVCRLLLQPAYADRLNKPLAYWALPSDRRLPLAFLGRTLKDLVETPFEELCATPGVGQKKMQSLIKLLYRATKDTPSLGSVGVHEDPERRAPEESPHNGRGDRAAPHGEFDANAVSEALWGRWRETVKRLRLEWEPLGRIAPSLQSLPTVIWRTPLKFYADRTLAEIRALRTHGEKRVRVVLEVFYIINQILSEARTHDDVAIRLTPRFAADLEFWIDEAVNGESPLTLEQVREQVAQPLLAQIQRDAGDSVYELAAGRLGMSENPRTVRHQSRQLGVTRARVYQLLDECSRIMWVRWPEGRSHLRALEEKAGADAEAEIAAFCTAVRELIFPDKYETVGLLEFQRK